MGEQPQGNIPPFDGIHNVLPPHLGSEAHIGPVSPWYCEDAELLARMGRTPTRRRLLRGLFTLRRDLLHLGVTGRQWIGGTFVEDIEAQEQRDPGDIDVVTFVDATLARTDLNERLQSSQSRLLERKHWKETYGVDHFTVPLHAEPWTLVEQAKFWSSLFCHRRDRVWKGMVGLSMRDVGQNDATLAILEGEP